MFLDLGGTIWHAEWQKSFIFHVKWFKWRVLHINSDLIQFSDWLMAIRCSSSSLSVTVSHNNHTQMSQASWNGHIQAKKRDPFLCYVLHVNILTCFGCINWRERGNESVRVSFVHLFRNVSQVSALVLTGKNNGWMTFVKPVIESDLYVMRRDKMEFRSL